MENNELITLLKLKVKGTNVKCPHGVIGNDVRFLARTCPKCLDVIRANGDIINSKEREI